MHSRTAWSLQSFTNPDTEDVEIIIDATDAALRLARERGIDLGAVHGTGKDGCITFRDVQDHQED